MALALWSTPSAAKRGLPDCSATYAPKVSGTKITSIAASTAQPWRVSPTMRPNV